MAAALVIALTGTAAGGHLSERDGGKPTLGAVNASGSPRYTVERRAALGSRSLDVSRSEKCPSAHRAVRFYSRRIAEHRAKMGVVQGSSRAGIVPRTSGCPRYLAHVLQRKARAWRQRVEAWLEYHYAWSEWLPDKWQRIGACETGYGRRPGRWDWNSGTYQGAFGFYHGSWDAFVPRADRKAGPYPSEAYQATPRQQYEVALAIYRMFGFSGWGCRGA